MSYSRVGVVTGANKGIGLAIVRQLALQYPKSSLNDGPLLIYLTARDEGRGKAALKQLEEDPQLKNAKALKADGGLSEIHFHALDITDIKSVNLFHEHLNSYHEDGIDFVINNAGIALDGFNPDIVKRTLDCNYYKTIGACESQVYLMRDNGRIVNLASGAGHLNKYSDQIRNRFLASKTVADVDSIMKDFTTAVEDGREKEAGFPSAAYAVSKAGLIGATRALAYAEKQNPRKGSAEEDKGKNILLNSVCPGYVNTEMTKGNGTLTPDEGAQTAVMLAIQDIKGQSGKFWRYKEVIEW